MNKKVFEVMGLTVELTMLTNCCILIITESAVLDINTWRVSMQTAYQQIPTLINLDEGITSNQTIDNLVKSVTKKIGLPVVASINVPVESISPGAMQDLAKLVLDNAKTLKVQEQSR